MGPPKPAKPPTRSICKRSMLSAFRGNGCACRGLKPNVFPSLVDGDATAGLVPKHLASHLTGSIRKVLHLHSGMGTRARQDGVPDLSHLFPALAARSLAGDAEGEVRRAAAVVRVHAGGDLGIFASAAVPAPSCQRDWPYCAGRCIPWPSPAEPMMSLPISQSAAPTSGWPPTGGTSSQSSQRRSRSGRLHRQSSRAAGCAA